MKKRIDRLRKLYRKNGISNYIATRASNIRWLCGFTGSNGLLFVTNSSAHLITDGRYTTQAKEQVKGAKVHIYSGGKSIADAFVREMSNNKAITVRGKIGVEGPFMTVDMYHALQEAFPKSKLVPTSNLPEDLAQIKEKYELDAIRKAVKATDLTFNVVLKMVKPGVREDALAAEIAYQHRKRGASKDSFDTIVASGPRSALPHGIASDKKIKKGEFITFDMGCLMDGYPSDMTRTVVLGKATAKQREVYNTVLKAQVAAVEAIKPGVVCSELDKIARDIIEAAGYGKYFSHGLGHGLGLEVHARPVLSKISNTKLEPGMVVTVEPGVYIPGWGGVRIEDDVLVTKTGYEILNKSSKKLKEL